jgi:hypothetical protein
MNKFLFFLLSIGFFGYSQTIVIPQKLQCERSGDDFQLKLYLKLALEKRGFKIFQADEMSTDNKNRPCDFYYADVLEENKLMSTKLKIVIHDCHRHEITVSDFGVSKEKEYKKAYQMAFREAEKTLIFNKKEIVNSASKNETIIENQINTTQIKEDNKTNQIIFAQPITHGFQLVNTKPEIVCKIFKTSQPKQFIVEKGALHGIGILNNNMLLIEYYQAGELIKETFEVKF